MNATLTAEGAVVMASKLLAGKPCRIEYLRAQDLQIDYRYQRHQSIAKIERIVQGFDGDAMGILLVSQRPDGSYWVMDGGHRLKAVLERFGPDVLVPCMVYTDIEWDRESSVFFKVNSERGPVTTSARFRAAYGGNDPEVRQIASVLDGLSIEYPWFSRGRAEASPNTIYCWVTLQQIYRREDISYLRDLLQLIQQTWEGEGESFHGLIVKAVDHLYRCHRSDDAWDNEEFVRRLRAHHPYQLRREAEIKTRRLPHLRIAEAMHEIYNKSKRIHRLDEFRLRPPAQKGVRTSDT